MKINTALILCAGYGKSLNPVTINKPKPLIKINDITLLENTINLITNLGIEKIKINTFYLSGQIEKFILNYKKKNVEIVKDGKEILDTGGGILNLIKSSDDENFFVFNPDTLWNFGYLETINKMEEIYFKNNICPSILGCIIFIAYNSSVLLCFILYTCPILPEPIIS